MDEIRDYYYFSMASDVVSVLCEVCIVMLSLDLKRKRNDDEVNAQL